MNLFVMLHYFDYALTFICSVGTITNRTAFAIIFING